MKDFKFFQRGDENNLTSVPHQRDTPEYYYHSRRLYHTNVDEYTRFRTRGELNQTIRQQIEDDERVARFIGRGFRQPTGINHRDNHGNSDHVSFFNNGSRVTKINPKWWMKIKMFFQTVSLYWDQIWGVFVFAVMATISVGLVISKILNVW